MVRLQGNVDTSSQSCRVHGVRLGAGDNSFVVRQDAIEVLNNTMEGLQVCRLHFESALCLSAPLQSSQATEHWRRA